MSADDSHGTEPPMGTPRERLARVWRLEDGPVRSVVSQSGDRQIRFPLRAGSIFATVLDSAANNALIDSESDLLPHKRMLRHERPFQVLISRVTAERLLVGFLEIHGEPESTVSAMEALAEALRPLANDFIQALSELDELRTNLTKIEAASGDSQLAALAFMSIHDLVHLYKNFQSSVQMLIELEKQGQIQRRQTRDQILQEVESSLAPLHNQFQHLVRLGRVGRDYTDRKRRLDLVDVAQDAIALFSPQAERFRVDLSLHSQGDPILKDVSKSQLDRVMYNLLSNAIYWSAQSWHSEVKVYVSESNNGVLLRVADNGPGVDPAHFDQIFSPGFSRRPGGAGLGLSSVQRSVTEMKGELTVQSQFGRGFTIEVQWT